MAGMPVVNIGVYLELAMAAHRELEGPGTVAVEGCVVRESLVLETGRVTAAQLVLDDGTRSPRAFDVYAEDRAAPSQPAWRLHAQGTVRGQQRRRSRPPRTRPPCVRAYRAR